MLTDLMGGEMTLTSRTEPGNSGSLFRIRLFLPELHGASISRAQAPRLAYSGPRKAVLVVDNEEVDRSLLAGRLQRIGFSVWQAASGAAALELLKETPVDAIFMDLAMPGIDGWQTIRSLRQQGLSQAPVAVVSANAFEKGQDNDVGIRPADFITKPVRFDELLDWLGERLQLQWLSESVPTPLTAPSLAPLPATPPPRELLDALQDAVSLGYPRGVNRAMDHIDSQHPECAAWLAPLRGLAQQFQFDRMTALIQDAVAQHKRN
jgi:CheY-like chemotaxis protein